MNEYIITPVSTQKNNIFYVTMCGISYPDIGYHIKRTHSDIFGIEYVLDGEGIVIANGKQYEVHKGDIYMLRQGSNHEYYAKSWEKIWLNAAGTLIEALLMTYNLESHTVIRGIDISNFLREIISINEANIAQPERNSQSALVLHRLFQFLNERLSKENIHISPEAIRLRDYIEYHSAENVTIRELANMIYRSESQTIRIFKTAFGVTPYEYLLSYRMNQAKLLLKNTNLLIKEIAFKVGFANEHYFSDIFKKKTGLTPKEFIKS